MSDVLSDTYWTTEFAITTADLDRLALLIESTVQAQHLSTLAKRVVAGRLRHGPEQGVPVNQLFATKAQVKLWDPAGAWQVGDHVIVLRKVNGRYVAYIGEVQAVDLGRPRIDVFLPEVNRLIPYEPMPADDSRRQQIIANVQEAIAHKREQLSGQHTIADQEELVEIVMLEHGERVVGLLLQALQGDKRFVLLNGRYFLRHLTIPVPESQLQPLAWHLLSATEPQPTKALLRQISPAVQEDAALFGLYLALQQHPEWFQNTQPGKRPLWALAGPPPGSFTPRHAAYDPESYEILCLPETEAPPHVVSRLWQTGLLQAVV
ncbi:MAG: hypothetical protein KDE56_02100 [Anaerolineales bacterium]|nr:hypothetical protein [Anaerolineales bacterium]